MGPRALQLTTDALATVAALGIVACGVVAWLVWDGQVNIGWWKVALDLTLLAGGTLLAFGLAGRAPRWVAVPMAALLLLWGWLGTWAYGFSWVPGAAAMVSCLLPRPKPGAAGPSQPPANV